MMINIIYIAKIKDSEIAIENFYEMMDFIEKYPDATIKSKIFVRKDDFK